MHLTTQELTRYLAAMTGRLAAAAGNPAVTIERNEQNNTYGFMFTNTDGSRIGVFLNDLGKPSALITPASGLQ